MRIKKFYDVPVTKETRELIRELKANDTYDSFLKKLSKSYKKHSRELL